MFKQDFRPPPPPPHREPPKPVVLFETTPGSFVRGPNMANMAPSPYPIRVLTGPASLFANRGMAALVVGDVAFFAEEGALDALGAMSWRPVPIQMGDKLELVHRILAFLLDGKVRDGHVDPDAAAVAGRKDVTLTEYVTDVAKALRLNVGAGEIEAVAVSLEPWRWSGSHFFEECDVLKLAPLPAGGSPTGKPSYASQRLLAAIVEAHRPVPSEKDWQDRVRDEHARKLLP